MTNWLEEGAAEIRALYESKLTDPFSAMGLIESGDRLWVPVGQQVDVLLASLTARAEELTGVEISMLPVTTYNWFEDGMREHLNIDILFCTPYTRAAANEGRADFTPWWIWGGHKGLDDGRDDARKIDAVILSCTPPNDQGYVCIGSNLWDAITSARRARKRIAVVSNTIPTTFGDTWMHISEFDALVEVNVDAALDASWAYPEPSDEAKAIAANIATLVKDRDTIQLGTGSTTGAIPRTGVLDDKKDLAYFGELTVPGTIELVKRGIITGKYLETHPGKFVTATAGNGPADVAYINNNPMFEFYPPEYMHHPGSIAKNKNMVAINNALSVDLGGQIAATTLGPRVWSGTGGHIAYALGAFLSPGGRYICALPSTAMGGAVSRITPMFEAGQVVTIQRELADYVVTEFGVARLLNRTLRERTKELISVAHPDHRAELRKEAEKMYGAW